MPTAFILTHESNPQRQTKSMSVIALALARSLGRRGVAVVRLHPSRLDHSLSSRYCRRLEICPDFYASEQELLDFLQALVARYPGPRVLIPGSDDCALFLSRYRDVLSTDYEVVAPSWSVMEDIIDKQHQYERAQAMGIPIPETYFPKDGTEVRALAGRLLHYPYVIKPLVAHAWRKASMQGVSGGKKGYAAGSPLDLIRHYERIAAGDKQVMIQEVIGGEDERLFTFLGYLDAQSQPLGYCVRRKMRQFPLDFGYCTLTESCSDPVVVEQSLGLLQGLGFQGIVGVEWKLDPRTGIYKLIEINARAVNTSALAPAAGVDLPWLAFLDKTGPPPSPVTTWQEGVKWSYLELDIWAARELHRQGRLSWREWRHSLAGKRVDAVFAWDDPWPFIHSFFAALGQRLKAIRLRRSKAQPKAETAPTTLAPNRNKMGEEGDWSVQKGPLRGHPQRMRQMD